jgi:hypothetical protein
VSPATTARALAGLQVVRGRPTAAQWVEALQIVAHGQRKPGHWLKVAFTPGGAAQITEHPLPTVEPA